MGLANKSVVLYQNIKVGTKWVGLRWTRIPLIFPTGRSMSAGMTAKRKVPVQINAQSQ